MYITLIVEQCILILLSNTMADTFFSVSYSPVKYFQEYYESYTFYPQPKKIILQKSGCGEGDGDGEGDNYNKNHNNELLSTYLERVVVSRMQDFVVPFVFYILEHFFFPHQFDNFVLLWLTLQRSKIKCVTLKGDKVKKKFQCSNEAM